MCNVKACIRRAAALFSAAVIITASIGISDLPAAQAYAKSRKSKTPVVKNVKKGTKVVSGSFRYKVTKAAKKKSTVMVLGLTKKAKKKLTRLVIPKTIRIRSRKGKNKGTYKYKVTAIAAKAFKGNTKVRTVRLGDNVAVIGDQAFAGCVNLKTVALGRGIKKIGEAAFAGDKNLIEVSVPDSAKIEEIGPDAFKGCESLKDIPRTEDDKKNGGSDNGSDDSSSGQDKSGGKDGDDGKSDNGSGGNEDGSGSDNSGNGSSDGSGSGNSGSDGYQNDDQDIKYPDDYSYEIIPLAPPFNSLFLIRTDNPSPSNFYFKDSDTVYSTGMGKIEPYKGLFADVVYEDEKTYRVNGGYLATGSNVDGGELQMVVESYYGSYDTEVTCTVQKVENAVDYLIGKYSDDSKPYFDNLTGIQAGLDKEALYSGVYVLGEQKKSETTPFYALSTSPHVDQIFYIQDPYYREGNKYMLMSNLYPMIYDSLAFPGTMSAIAKKLNSEASVKWDSSSHAYINVTYNGETRTYGGAGEGKGQGIKEDQLKYFFKFDGSLGDAANDTDLATVKARIREYSTMDVPEDPKDQPELKWADVRNTVGKDGAYVKLILLTSIYGGSSEGYTYMYDDGSNTEGTNGWGAVGHFSNVWFDGRYINKWEFFEKGASFNKTVESDGPGIVLRDPVMKLPDDGRTYQYNYKDITEDIYDPETGTWKGLMRFYFNNSDTDNPVWKADLLDFGTLTYKDEEGKRKYVIDDQDFIDACTLTMEEVKALGVDANTNVDPASYYIYDGTRKPGTYHAGD